MRMRAGTAHQLVVYKRSEDFNLKVSASWYIKASENINLVNNLGVHNYFNTDTTHAYLRSCQELNFEFLFDSRVFCLPVASLKSKRLKYTKVKVWLLFCMSVTLGLSR